VIDGQVEILDLHHLFFTAPDLAQAESWWIDELGATPYKQLPFLESEQRWASFVRLAGETIEPMQVAAPGPDRPLTPVQRFVERLGYRWHSIAWFTPDMAAIHDRLQAAGCRLFHGGGASAGDPNRPYFTHPRDTFVALEFLPSTPDGQGGESAEIAAADGTNHLGIRGLAWLTVVPHDRQAAIHFFERVLDAPTVWSGRDADTGTDSTFVRAGRTLIELVDPESADGRHRETDVLHSVTFGVDDIASLRAGLGEDVLVLRETGTDLVVAPPFAADVRIGFTVREVGADHG
jgi:catechol 2,3-dioxygenase-like lactoylglutathione lyase family enzyme